MNLEEINQTDPLKLPYIVVNLAMANAVERLSVAVDKLSGRLLYSHPAGKGYRMSGLRHIAVTPKQWNETWSALPPDGRFNNEDSARTKAGFNCYPVGNLLVWMDRLMPEDQWSEEVEDELKRELVSAGQRHTRGE